MPDELLVNPDAFDAEDHWEVLRRGEYAGRFSAGDRAVHLVGAALYQVHLDQPDEMPDGEGGPDAPHGLVGLLVAVCSRRGMLALHADGRIHLADMSAVRTVGGDVAADGA